MMSDPTEPINPVPRPAGPQLWIRDDIGIVRRAAASGHLIQYKFQTRPGVDKVKPKRWFKYSLQID